MTDDRKIVAFDRRRRTPDPARVREFAATARLLQREREEAAEMVERILRDTPRAEWARLAEEPSMRNSGVLDRLSREVQARLDRDPQEALALSNLATAIAETLAADAYPPIVLAQMRAQAWKDRAQSLSCVARYDEALASLDRADSHVCAFGTLAHDRAVLQFARAAVLQDVDRFEDSLGLLIECKGVFRDHGDVRLQFFCSIWQAAVLHRLKRFREARDMYEELLPAVAEGDAASRACLHNNLGNTLIELGEYEQANVHLSEALAILTDLGRPVDATRTALAHGRLLVRKGEADRGVAALHEVRARFIHYGLVEEAGLCGLDIIDALLAGGDAARAESLARDIIGEFTAANLGARAVTALGYLQEAIAARTASRETVDGVRGHIRALRKEPECHFASQ